MPVHFKLALAAVLTATSLTAQTSPIAQQLTTRCDPPPGSLRRLSRAQKKAFLSSQDMFVAGRNADALKELRVLLAQMPPNTAAQTAMAERTAEVGIEAEQLSYAISLLKPIEERDGNDCLARVLLARADAEDGRTADRDAEMAALTMLHNEAPESPAGKLDVFLLEQHRLSGGVARIWYALRPFGPHNTYLYSDVLNASGAMMLRIELDSDDPDQIYFRQIHPGLAARGDRRFSLDAFGPDRTLPNGTIDHPHSLIQFFDGKPSYEVVRERILTIADRIKPAA